MYGFNNVPFLYIPNGKKYTKNYLETIQNMDPIGDLYEFILPRNIEFTIEKIEDKFYDHRIYKGNNTFSYKKIISLLSKKGLYGEKSNSKENSTITDLQDENAQLEEDKDTDTNKDTNKDTDKDTDSAKEKDIKNIIENKINELYNNYIV